MKKAVIVIASVLTAALGGTALLRYLYQKKVR